MHMFSKMPLRNNMWNSFFILKLHNIFSDSIHGMDFQLILCVRNDLITYVWQLFGFYKVSCSLWHYSQIFVCYFRKPRKIIIPLYLTTVSFFSPMSLRKILHQDRSAFKLEKENRWVFFFTVVGSGFQHFGTHSFLFWKQFARPLIGFCLKEYFYVEAATCMNIEEVNWFLCRVQGKLSAEEETHSWC